jgi:Tfp pilus assembly protein PilF
MAINLAPGWYRPRVSRALLFAANGKELEAGSELADAMRELPENLELHLAAAEFYLASVDGVPRNVILAQRISTTAIRISERLDPTAWRLNAKALLADQNFEDARDSIMESINLQEKPNQEDLLMLQMINKALGITSEQEKDAAHATVIKSNEP